MGLTSICFGEKERYASFIPKTIRYTTASIEAVKNLVSMETRIP